MSGTVTSNTLRSSGVIAATAAGLNWVSTPVTASTVTVESGNGYWINTTSNAITITLPSSAEKGDQIVFIDYLRTWGTNEIIIDSNGLNYQGEDDSYTVEYTTSGQSLNIVYSDATKGWIPLDDDTTAFEPVAPRPQNGIIAFGNTGSNTAVSNLINSSGVVASDTAGVGTARYFPGGLNYGGDKGIFAFGQTASANVSMSNLVSNSGVVATDTTGVGTARYEVGDAGYGNDKGIIAYGTGGSPSVNISNLISSSGVVSSDVTGVGTSRSDLAGTTYGTDKAIFAYGLVGSSPTSSLSNLVSSSGVVASDTSGVGTGRKGCRGCGYGSTGQAIIAYGTNTSSYHGRDFQGWRRSGTGKNILLRGLPHCNCLPHSTTFLEEFQCRECTSRGTDYKLLRNHVSSSLLW